MDRIDRERFGRLRNHLANTTRDAIWQNALCFMLLRAAREHPEMYQGMWVSYLSGLRGMWDEPLRMLGSMHDIRLWSEVAPFALFNVYMPNKIARDNMHALCNMPLEMRIKTLNLERNVLRPKHIKQLASSTQLGRVECLDLSNNKLSETSIESLLTAPHFKGLREIRFDYVNLPMVKDRERFTRMYGKDGELSIVWH